MNNEIKNLFRAQAESHDSDLDTAALWKAIEAKRKPKKKRRLFLWLPFGILLCSMVYVLFSDQNASNELVPTLELSTTEAPLTTRSTGEIHESITTTELESQKSDTQSPNEKVENNLSLNLKKKQNIATQQRAKTRKENARVDAKTTNLIVANSITVNSFIRKQELEIPVVEKTKSTQNNNQANNVTVAKSSPVANNTTEASLFLQPLQSRMFSISWAERNIQNSGEISLVSTQENPETDREETTSKRSSLFDLSLMGSISMFKTAYANDVDAISASEWSSTLSPFITVSSDIIFGWNVSDRIKLSSGLSYSKLSEKMTWDGQYIIDKNGQYVSEVDFENPLLSLVGSNSNEKLFQLVTQNILHYNEYHLIDIPLMLQVKIIDKRLELSTYVSTSINLWSSQSGYILSDNAIPAELGDRVQQKVGIAYGGGLELGYGLGESFSLVSRAQLTTRKLSVHNIDRRMTQPELYVGLRRHF